MAIEMVKVYYGPGDVAIIPKCELAPGMVKVEVEGMDGEYWVRSEFLKPNIVPKHAPFEGELRNKIMEIRQCLNEVYPLTCQEWEDGFRCDRNPKSEIELWHVAALKFRSITETRYYSLPQKEDIFVILVSILSGGRDAKTILGSLSTLSNEEAQEILDEFLEW